MQEIGPTFFVVGAMKAGTTSICQYIAQHPDVFVSTIKEPNYYVWENLDNPDALTAVGARGLTSVRLSQAINTPQKYAALFSAGIGHLARGEGSTAYLAHPDAAPRIHKHHPNAKIVAILRNPIARAYSAYTYNKAAGLEPSSTFREAIESELAGKRDQWFYRWRYLHCGNYARQIERYLGVFDKANVLLLESEELKSDAARTCRRIFGHIGVECGVEIRTSFEANRTSMPRGRVSRAIISGLNGDTRLKSLLKRAIPAAARYAIKTSAIDAVGRFGDRPQPMAPGDEALLADYYGENVKAVEQLTGWNLRAWRAVRGHQNHIAKSR